MSEGQRGQRTGHGNARQHPSHVDTSANWIVYGDELCPIGKRGFHFDLTDHLRNAFHHLVAGENLPARGHELRDGLFITRSLEDEIADERDAFGIVELDATREPRSRDRRGKCDHQLVFFTRGEIHVSSDPRGQQDHILGTWKGPGPSSSPNCLSSRRKAWRKSDESAAANRTTMRPPTNVAA